MKEDRTDYAIAVIDIGKTNKKVAVFSSNLRLVHTESTQIGETTVDGFLSDDILRIKGWVLEKLKQLFHEYPIKVISITTFGATIAVLDQYGNLVFPVVSYQQEPPNGLKDRFLEAFGGKGDLYLRTGTPLLGQLLNVGVQLFWLKEENAQRFLNVKSLLFFPQYFGYLLTGERAIEYTSLGCHTFLYDFMQKGWSNVARIMDLTAKFPARFSHPWDTLGNLRPELLGDTQLERECKVTVGLHDSNASILPYLLDDRRNFVLASTGTWCEFMCPGIDYSPSVDDLNRNILYYLDPSGRPEKATDFKGGEEHEHYGNLIKRRFDIEPVKIQLKLNLLEDILTANDCFVIPTLTPGAGQFPESNPRIIEENMFYRDVETGYHVLSLSLAIQSYFAIKNLTHKKGLETIFVEGGFRRNSIYLTILSTLFPEQEVITSHLQEATSLGAAICGKCAHEGISPKQIDSGLIDIDEIPIEKLHIERKAFDRYINKFERYCEEN